MQKNAQVLGYAEGWISVVLNTALFGVKYWVGTTYGSVAMVADAWHTLSDTLTSVVVIIGFFIAYRPADKGHPFGHGRAEPIGAVIIATLLGVVAATFLKESVNRLRHFQAASFGMTAVIVFGISVVLKEALAEFSYWAGRKIGSESLRADGWHHRSDAIASAMIVAGALVGRYLWWIDGVMGIAISLLILWATIDILRSAATALLGEKPTKELEDRLGALISRETPTATHFHHLHVHTYGGHRELTFHLDFPPDMRLHEAHVLASRVESAVRRELSAEATIHIEPSDAGEVSS
ncbi:MAG TPA: cation diffusion facilitator family transporter [Spirochaetia bacterium]|nr:cation diffusion facilitator family transporter [Spirochaetia bacterium]